MNSRIISPSTMNGAPASKPEITRTTAASARSSTAWPVEAAPRHVERDRGDGEHQAAEREQHAEDDEHGGPEGGEAIPLHGRSIVPPRAKRQGADQTGAVSASWRICAESARRHAASAPRLDAVIVALAASPT